MDTNKIAIEAIRARIQKIAFDANLFDLGIADYPYSEKCSKERKKLLAAIEKIEGRKIAKPLNEVDTLQLSLLE